MLKDQAKLLGALGYQVPVNGYACMFDSLKYMVVPCWIIAGPSGQLVLFWTILRPKGRESGVRKIGLDPADAGCAFGSPCTEVTWG